MKKIILATLILVGIFSCGGKIGVVTIPSGTITIEAQTLPITRVFAWDVVSNADAYNVGLDGTNIGAPTVPQQSFTITSIGTHTLTVSAFNTWGTGPISTLIINVVVPGAPANLKVH